MRRSARILGYVRPRVSHHAETQRQAIIDAARANSWRLVAMLEEAADDGARLDRPQLQHALRLLAHGDAHGLVVSTLDRLTPSLLDFGELVHWFTDADTTLVVLQGLKFDTSSPEGQQIADGLAAFGHLQHEWASDRIREDLLARRRSGRPISRPAVSDHPQLAASIQELRETGHTIHEIADELNARGIPTIRGGARWRASSVQTALGYKRPQRTRTPARLPPPRPEA